MQEQVEKFARDWFELLFGGTEQKYRSLFLPGVYSTEESSMFKSTRSVDLTHLTIESSVDKWTRDDDGFHRHIYKNQHSSGLPGGQIQLRYRETASKVNNSGWRTSNSR